MKELSENEIQRAVFKHLRTRGAPGVFAFHPKNASSDMRGRRRGIYAGLGIVPGIPDVIVIHRLALDMLPRLYALELKRADRRRQDNSEHDQRQQECRNKLREVGATVGIAYGLDDALIWLEENGLLRGKAT